MSLHKLARESLEAKQKRTEANCFFRAITFACGRMRFVLYSPAQARLRSQGEYSIKRSLGEMIALQAQAQKFLMQLFSKSCDFGRLF
jgi:hypothetical protein